MTSFTAGHLSMFIMEIVHIALILAGLVAIGLEALKKTNNTVSYGWLGVFLIGVDVLLGIVVK